VKPEQQLIACAEADGWRFAGRVSDRKANISWDVYEKNGHRCSFYLHTMPDYMNDLNVVHALAMAQPEAIRKHMRFWLHEITSQMSWHFASAAQMVEALLRSLGKWVE
jgi:hypothetical protein